VLLDGHDGLRKVDAPRADERSVQFLEGAAGAVRPELIRPVRAVAPVADHDDGLDWNDIATVVEHLRALRASKGSIVAGRRAARARGSRRATRTRWRACCIGARLHTRGRRRAAASPASAGPMTAQSRADFTANWDRQVGCPDQYEPAASAAVWSDNARVDSVARPGARAFAGAPLVPTWVSTKQSLQRCRRLPDGDRAHDKQSRRSASRPVRGLGEGKGDSRPRLLLHNAMWEKNHLLLFKASLDWLKEGKVNGVSAGELKLGY